MGIIIGHPFGGEYKYKSNYYLNNHRKELTYEFIFKKSEYRKFNTITNQNRTNCNYKLGQIQIRKGTTNQLRCIFLQYEIFSVNDRLVCLCSLVGLLIFHIFTFSWPFLPNPVQQSGEEEKGQLFEDWIILIKENN
jgi:hypothetical protein